MAEYKATINFYAKDSNVNVLEGEVIELDTEVAETINQRAKELFPELPEFLVSVKKTEKPKKNSKKKDDEDDKADE